MAKKHYGGRKPTTQTGEIVSPYLLARRAEVAGCSTKDATRPEAGYALGQLLLRGVVNQRQHDAGMAYRDAWLRWASLAGIPPHEATQRGKSHVRPDLWPETWAKAKGAYFDATDAISALEQGAVVSKIVEAVLMDNWPGDYAQTRMFLSCENTPNMLRAGLNALASHYRMPDRMAG